MTMELHTNKLAQKQSINFGENANRKKILQVVQYS